MSKAEKFISDCTRNCSNLAHFEDLNGDVWEENTPWLTPDQARRAVEIAEEEIYKWLLKNAHIYSIGAGLYTHAMINDLKQAMKDE